MCSSSRHTQRRKNLTKEEQREYQIFIAICQRAAGEASGNLGVAVVQNAPPKKNGNEMRGLMS
jgi:diadenosine tetraphosphate (Ap4A) HIT family hydrolase